MVLLAVSIVLVMRRAQFQFQVLHLEVEICAAPNFRKEESMPSTQRFLGWTPQLNISTSPLFIILLTLRWGIMLDSGHSVYLGFWVSCFQKQILGFRSKWSRNLCAICIIASLLNFADVGFRLGNQIWGWMFLAFHLRCVACDTSHGTYTGMLDRTALLTCNAMRNLHAQLSWGGYISTTM